jgi:uncharacterized membrane protein YdjX (TVP38/TMEM64 family)
MQNNRSGIHALPAALSKDAVMSDNESARKSNTFRNSAAGIAGSVIVVGALIAVLMYFDVHLKLVDLLRWIDGQGAMAAVLFIGVMTLVMLLLLPGVFFTVGAGYVFGIAEGVLYVVAGSTLGAALAFLIARYLFGAKARNFIMQRSKLNSVNEEMTRHDFKVVLLTRLIPFFPGKLSNYFFGLTQFRFRNYVLATALGYIPFTLHNVYLGSLISDLSELGQGGLGRSPAQWALYGFGFLATIIAIVYFNMLAKRALSQYTTEGKIKDAST